MKVDHNITYRVGYAIGVGQYRDLLNSSTLGERRPVGDETKLASMLRNSNLQITAWDGDTLVGLSRCMSDFAHMTYCADLCVRTDYQRRGIGKQLLRETLKAGGCRITLLAAPKAVDYYPSIGMERHPSAWITNDQGIA